MSALPCGRPAADLLRLVADRGRPDAGPTGADPTGTSPTGTGPTDPGSTNGVLTDGGPTDGGPDGELARHAAACPHCRAELAELERTWAGVRAAAATPPPTPDGLAERVVGTLRGLRAAGGTHYEVAEGVRVAERVVVLIARRAAADAAGGGVRAVHTGQDGVVHIDIAVRYGEVAAVLAERVRRAVLAAVAAQVGPVVSAVDVQVTDVIYPPLG